MLVDQVAAGGLGVAGEVAGDRLEQDAALVGGVAVVVAVVAAEAVVRRGAGDDRSGAHKLAPPGCGMPAPAGGQTRLVAVATWGAAPRLDAPASTGGAGYQPSCWRTSSGR